MPCVLPGLRASDHGRGCKYPDPARDPDVGPVSRFYHKVRALRREGRGGAG